MPTKTLKEITSALEAEYCAATQQSQACFNRSCVVMPGGVKGGYSYKPSH